ncbi:MAG: hypothetical protein ABI220_04200 [Candidatus Saccharimonadales bacterium]
MGFLSDADKVIEVAKVKHDMQKKIDQAAKQKAEEIKRSEAEKERERKEEGFI